eukprot:TRINITY_DN23427_c0_g1_i1.p2 TRINITY_DN23427_c0_g1~~TRINITY_DN23427_c0_g1_i1.p2  ORF type:complete len:103 (-),score=1.77 TRINITY_DN23427_c0_g1_i1:236-544(-)
MSPSVWRYSCAQATIVPITFDINQRHRSSLETMRCAGAARHGLLWTRSPTTTVHTNRSWGDEGVLYIVRTHATSGDGACSSSTPIHANGHDAARSRHDCCST